MSRPRAARTARAKLLVVLGVVGLAASLAAMSLAASPPAAPTLTSTPPAPSASTSASFSFTGPGGATLECRLDASSFAACTSPKTYSGMALGSHTFRVRATKSGQTSSETAYTWSVVVPTAAIATSPANPTNSQSASFTFTADASNATFECKLDAAAFAACTSPKSYSGLAASSHTFQVRALGSAGTGAAASRTWAVDLTPPAAPAITGGPPASPAWTTSTSATFTFTGETGATFQCKLDGAAFAACSSPRSYSGLAQGSHSFQVQQTDAAGNQGPAASWTFFVDTVPPTRPVFSQTPPDPSSSTSATFAWSSTDPAPSSGIAGYLCSKENGSYAPCSSPLTYTVEATNNGQHQFAVVAVDRAGNVSPAASYTWKVATDSGKSFTIAGSVSGLFPGAWQSIPVTITNPNNQVLYVTSLSVTASGAPGGCDSSSNIETQPSSASSANKLAVPANASNWPVPAGPFQPRIRLRNTAGNQDNCKSRTFGLSFTGSGTNQP